MKPQKQWVPPNRPNEYTDTARIGKKITSADIKIKVQTKEVKQ